MKTLMVLPGGGAAGAIQAGMILGYVDAYGWPMSIIGTSVGAMNGAMAATKSQELIRRVWLDISGPRSVYEPRFLTDFISKITFFSRSSIYSFSPLKKMIEKKLDLKQLVESDVDFWVCYWNANEDRSVIMNKKNPNIIDGIIASAGIPIAFPEVIIDGEYCFDGGVKDGIPTKFAFKKDANGLPLLGFVPDRVVILSPVRVDKSYRINGKFDKITKIAPRVIDGLTSESIYNDMELTLLKNRLPEYKSVELVISQPYRTNIDTLEFDPNKIAEAMLIGKDSLKHNTYIYNESNGFIGEPLRF